VQRSGVLVQEVEIGRPSRLPMWIGGCASFARAQPVGFVSGLVILCLVVVAVFADIIAPYDPFAITAGDRLLSPSGEHLFGTDARSRDVFSRIVWGARVSIQVGLLSVSIGIGSGVLVGIVTGYFGGWLDTAVQRVMDALMSFPMLVKAMALAAVFGPGVFTAAVAIGVAIVPGVNRMIRGATLSAKQNQYVEAGLILGASHRRILFRYILPNVAYLIFIMVSIMMGLAIVIEASLSFLGLGVQSPNVSWGRMLNEGRSMMEDAPWLIIAPAATIGIVVLAFNMLGDALRDYLDPTLRNLR